ncbi:hypothetical protein [Candidatus Villigracilis vicinus]|uniref:hypothetical protein n=1 Tax=Candidatus Villigracilis vicinus TaxID=3140679 RepID=UPI0031ED4EEE
MALAFVADQTNAVIGSCRQVELTHCRPHQALTFGLELTKLPYLPDAHVCVANNVGGIGEALILNVSCDLHALADGFAGFTEFISAEFFVVHRGLDVDVNAVKQWTGDAFLVFSDDGWGAGTGFLRISKITTRAGVYIRASFCQTTNNIVIFR